MIPGTFDFVDVRDVASGMVSAGRVGRAGEAYLLSGTRIELEKFRSSVQRELGFSKPPVRIGFGTARLYARFAAPLQRLFGTASSFTRYAINTIQEDVPIVRRKAESELM